MPEIEEGIVEIKAVAREPGHRSKIAVSSHEPGVDPVGACVGPKGSPRAHGRERAARREDRRRAVDATNPGEFVANALQPAKVKEVRIDADAGTALVIVPDYQLSLAIGKEGQNARLAAQAHRMADRHQVRDAGRRGGSARPRRAGAGGRRRRPRAGARRGARARGRPPEPEADREPAARPSRAGRAPTARRHRGARRGPVEATAEA